MVAERISTSIITLIYKGKIRHSFRFKAVAATCIDYFCDVFFKKLCFTSAFLQNKDLNSSGSTDDQLVVVDDDIPTPPACTSENMTCRLTAAWEFFENYS